MRKLTDEEARLVEQNHNLIYGFMRKYKFPEDDWYDVAATGFVKAAQTYSPGENQFSTYAYRCMLSEARVELTYRDRHWKQALSLDYEYENDEGGSYTIADSIVSGKEFEVDVVEEIYQSDLLNFLFNSINQEDEKSVLKLLIAGNNIHSISNQLGISRWYVEKHIKMIKRKYAEFQYKKTGVSSKSANKKKNKPTPNIEKDIQNYRHKRGRTVSVGDKLKVPGERTKYLVRARDDRYIICTRPYNNTVIYFIVDLERGVRGEDNMIFCSGYETDEQCLERLKELQNGEISVSKRNYIKLDIDVA